MTANGTFRYASGTPRPTGGSRVAWGRAASAALAAAALLAAVPSPGHAWGARTHEIINRRAVEVMPEPARTAWRPLAVPLGQHASDADMRKSSVPSEAPRHYIDIDFFEPHPFGDVPRTREGMRRKYGEDAEKWGVAPWAIDECYRMLVLSLERGDWSSAGGWAADLGHYVADTHQPLHVTVNYDGQKTGHDGVHLRFEVRMMDRHYDEAALEPLPLPSVTGDVPDLALGWIAEAYPGLATILEGDETARAVDPDYGEAYLDALWGVTRGVAEVQVSRAVRDLAGLYTSAWRAAGSPPGPAAAPPLRALPVDVLDPPAAPAGRSGLRALFLAGGVLASALALAAL